MCQSNPLHEQRRTKKDKTDMWDDAKFGVAVHRMVQDSSSYRGSDSDSPIVLKMALERWRRIAEALRQPGFVVMRELCDHRGGTRHKKRVSVYFFFGCSVRHHPLKLVLLEQESFLANRAMEHNDALSDEEVSNKIGRGTGGIKDWRG
ncbi:hypothetical protein ARMSODRAFT_983733 [Armillaria solidipes]|uniref:Uncharacterized protein n=1 Tax=Armillaria solidipes TaxID=1076256 RepID=A0A2H3B6B0_9AGAR|nr:hypothetical protein ARMSODRAFT_983733 [Armillaria solidipes]